MDCAEVKDVRGTEDWATLKLLQYNLQNQSDIDSHRNENLRRLNGQRGVNLTLEARMLIHMKNITRVGADILFLQEVPFAAVDMKGNAQKADTYWRAHLPKGYDFVFVDHSYAPIIMAWKTDRLAKIEDVAQNLIDSGEIDQELLDRFLLLKFNDILANKDILVANCHLKATLDKSCEDRRVAQIAAAKKAIESRMTETEHVIWAGDFNMESNLAIVMDPKKRKRA